MVNTIELTWCVYSDDDELVASFADEREAWRYTNEATARLYVEDGCFYVERADVEPIQ
jgi:hypothetical protein